jgi:hypothetical protein
VRNGTALDTRHEKDETFDTDLFGPLVGEITRR